MLYESLEDSGSYSTIAPVDSRESSLPSAGWGLRENPLVPKSHPSTGSKLMAVTHLHSGLRP